MDSPVRTPDPPTTAYDRLYTLLAEREADAFVHVGDRFDDLLRYLTRFSGPDRDYAFVYTEGQAALCAPRLFAQQANREFPGDRVYTVADQSALSASSRAMEALDDLADSCSSLLVPASFPSTSYRDLDVAVDTIDVLDTAAEDVGRRRKTTAERACHAAVQAAAQRGMARAEAVLAASERDGDELQWEGSPLTTERLRREVNAVLAADGVRDADNTVIGAGETCTDLHFTGTDGIHPDETVLLDLSPRGPHGYYGDFTRTFVAGEVDEWESTAYAAVTEAQDAALAALEDGAGTVASDAHAAATEVLSEHGFASGEVDVGMYHGVGHGVGVSLHEAPSLTSDTRLEAGNVVTVEPGVYDPAHGGVRIEDLVVITEDGYENLTEYPRELTPQSTHSRWEP
ncbi:M24 family metallopeptidase [Halorussus aquaticus]|uniref:M24 family metallopeptidase n=1 Tax=Halorussus aquaticus TaxID=2953748 RepID=A0ABD5Q5S6_9EURY|nr:Xaa-Pro peptidase family protein [Halorussus aquaticus]